MIRVLKAFLAAMTIATALASCATVASDHAAYDPKLDGFWQGSITLSDTPKDVLELRLLIGQGAPRVWLQDNGAWTEAKPGAFRISRNMGNAVIYATDSGTDGDGTWVESWAIVATPRSPEDLLVVWSRVVNNLDMPLEKESSKYGLHASGILHRVPRGG